MKNNKRKIKRLFYLRVAVFMTFFLGLCLAFSSLPVQAARLFGVTGDQFNNTPSTPILFELSQVDGSIIQEITPLGNGNGGEAIAFNPDDGLLYHWSGWSTSTPPDQIFESIDLNTLAINPITLSGANYDQTVGATYNPLTREFLVVSTIWTNELYTVTTGGIVTFKGPIEHNSKGLAFVGSTLYSINKRRFDGGVVPPHLVKINPTDGTTISSIEISLPGFTITGANGLATNPDDGVMWGLLKADDGNGIKRRIVTINPITGDATDIGIAGDEFTVNHFASIAFAFPVSATQHNAVCEIKVANDDTGQHVAKSLHFETYNTDPELLNIWNSLFGVDPETSPDYILTLQDPDRTVTWEAGTLEMGGLMTMKVKTDKSDSTIKNIKIERAGKNEGTTSFVSGTGGVNPNLADGGWHEVKIKNMDGVTVTIDGGDPITGFLKELKVKLDKDGTTASPLVKDFKLKIKGVTTAPDVKKGYVNSVVIDVPETVVTAIAGAEYEEKIKAKPEVLSGHTEAEFERESGAETEGVGISSLHDGNNDQLKERKGACVIDADDGTEPVPCPPNCHL